MPFDGTQLSEVTKLLINGRALLANGWVKGHYKTQKGEYCMLGALGYRRAIRIERAVVRRSGTKRLAAEYVRLALETQGYNCKYVFDIPGFNDRPSFTHEQALATLDKAIELSMEG